jgi:hypothetical protein
MVVRCTRARLARTDGEHRAWCVSPPLWILRARPCGGYHAPAAVVGVVATMKVAERGRIELPRVVSLVGFRDRCRRQPSACLSVSMAEGRGIEPRRDCSRQRLSKPLPYHSAILPGWWARGDSNSQPARSERAASASCTTRPSWWRVRESNPLIGVSLKLLYRQPPRRTGLTRQAWSARLESNQQPPASQTGTSASWATRGSNWWASSDSNRDRADFEPAASTNCARGPKSFGEGASERDAGWVVRTVMRRSDATPLRYRVSDSEYKDDADRLNLTSGTIARVADGRK